MSALLEVRDLDLHYGDFQALFDINLSLSAGEVLAVIGANGAGKSSLMRAVSGLSMLTSGDVLLDGESVARFAPFARVRRGIALTPEGRRIFKSLSVEENLKVGAHTKRHGPWNLEAVYEAFPLVRERRHRLGANLSGGEQQVAAIARALMSNPKVLMLDEASLGLAPVAVADIYNAIPAIVQNGTSVLLVEQDVNQAMRVADRLVCLLEGHTVLEGTPTTLTRDEIAAAYFGLKEN
jgi:branched-chain amino acid transport system ATP-binding protein